MVNREHQISALYPLKQVIHLFEGGFIFKIFILKKADRNNQKKITKTILYLKTFFPNGPKMISETRKWLASGIEFSALKTFCSKNFTIDQKVSLILDSIMMLYEVPKEKRREVVEKILLMNYEEIARDMFERFVQRLDN